MNEPTEVTPEEKIKLSNDKDIEKKLEELDEYKKGEKGFKASSLRLDFQTGLVLFFIGITGAMIFYMMKKELVFSLVMASILTIPIGMILGIFTSTNIRIKLLRRITRKNLGFVKFVSSKGIAVKTVVSNLDKDRIRYQDGDYIIDRSMVKRTLDETYSDKTYNKPLKDFETIAKFEEGIPTIYFDVDDAIPLNFSNIEYTADDKYRLPKQISATLNKEIAVEKAKALKTQSRNMLIFLVVIVGVCLITAYMTWQTQDKIGKIQSTVAATQRIEQKLDTLNSLLSKSQSGVPVGQVVPTP